jgi:hypothetical protein
MATFSHAGRNFLAWVLLYVTGKVRGQIFDSASLADFIPNAFS